MSDVRVGHPTETDVVAYADYPEHFDTRAFVGHSTDTDIFAIAAYDYVPQTEEEATQAGFRSLLAPWIGGAVAYPVTINAGFRSLLAPWVGGASADPAPVVTAGFRGLFAFWMGGGAGSVEEVTRRAGGADKRRKKQYIWIGDEIAKLIDGAEPEVVEPHEAPKEAPHFEEIREVAEKFGQEARVLEMFEQRDYADMLALYESMLDEEDVEMLLMLA